MANEIHLSYIKQGAEVWNQWRAQHNILVPDLSECDLTGINLAYCDLSGANLYQSVLVNTNLEKVNLTGANLFGAKLNSAKLSDVNLSSAVISDVDLTAAVISDVDLTAAVISDVDLTDAVITDVDLTRAVISDKEWVQLALDAGGMGTFVWYPTEDRGEPDERMLALFGLAADSTLSLASALAKLIHPQDRTRYAEAVAHALEPSGTGWLQEDIRVVQPDGSERWLAIAARTYFGTSDQPTRMVGMATDITRRKETEAALRTSESRFHTLTDTVPQMIWTNDASGKAEYFNSRWFEYSGLSFEQSFGLGWQVMVHPDDEPPSVERWHQALAKAEIFETEYRLRRADGSYRWHIGRNVPLKDAEDRILSWFGTATDIEDIKQAEAAVRESEERFRLLVEGAEDYAIFLIDPSRRIIHWNVGAERMFGFTRKEAIGQSADMIFTPEDRATGMPQKEAQTAATAGRASDRRWHIRRNGERFWADGMMMSLRDEAGQVRGFVKIARDATHERQAEEALQEVHDRLEVRVAERTMALQKSQEQLRRLSMHTEHAREAERIRIAREVHDELGGGLTGLKLHIGSLSWGREADDKLRATLDDVKDQIDQLVATVRRIASDLRPPLLDDLGLSAAMEWHATGWCKQTNIEYVLDLLMDEPPVNHEQRTAIFRVFQESLTNVARHAHATKVMVTMALEDETLVLCIEDNGVGIDPAVMQATKSLGLMGMQERMREVGGSVKIVGQPGQGTTVVIRVPIHTKSDPGNTGAPLPISQ